MQSKEKNTICIIVYIYTKVQKITKTIDVALFVAYNMNQTDV